MKKTILMILINNYGFSITYNKSQKNYNTNCKDHKNDGSIKKFKFQKSIYEFSDWQFSLRYFWNNVLIFRIHMNR